MARNKIFLTDDDEDDRLLIRAALESVMDEINIIEAASGEALLESLAEYGGSDIPSVILMDMNMPMMTGLETLIKLRTLPEYHHIPVMMISTTTNEQLIRQSYELGVNAFLEKPVLEAEFRRLAQAVELCLCYDVNPSLETARDQLSPDMNIVLIGEDTRALADALPAAQISELIPGSPDEIMKQLGLISWSSGDGADLILLVPGPAGWQQNPDQLTNVVITVEKGQPHYTPVILLGHATPQQGEPEFHSSQLHRTNLPDTPATYLWQPSGHISRK